MWGRSVWGPSWFAQGCHWILWKIMRYCQQRFGCDSWCPLIKQAHVCCGVDHPSYIWLGSSLGWRGRVRGGNLGRSSVKAGSAIWGNNLFWWRSLFLRRRLPPILSKVGQIQVSWGLQRSSPSLCDQKPFQNQEGWALGVVSLEMKDVGWRRKNGKNNCTSANDQIDISYLQLRGNDYTYVNLVWRY